MLKHSYILQTNQLGLIQGYIKAMFPNQPVLVVLLNDATEGEIKALAQDLNLASATAINPIANDYLFVPVTIEDGIQFLNNTELCLPMYLYDEQNHCIHENR